MKINIVMVEPEIPQNTGNIARTCAITGAKLHLVHPLGFRIDEKSLKRAGLDYWDKLDIEEHDSLDEFLKKYKPEENNMFFATTKGKTKYTDIDYSKMDEVFVLYGKETKGLPEWLLEKYLNTKTIRIPMLPTLRSLNLSNSVAIITYEILRQKGFEEMEAISHYFD
ncbi:MAG: tRNA (uridine(34)/cytosine(34)/5-carboxymethylaminomethyluridine(34)-2'-O)-methyltransferase TrmL [Christensenellales bacterium]